MYLVFVRKNIFRETDMVMMTAKVDKKTTTDKCRQNGEASLVKT